MRRAKFTESGVESALSYSRDAYEIVSGTGSEVSKLVEAGFSNLNKNLAAVVDKAVKSAPAGSDVAVTALKSTMAATTAAFDSLTKATRQVVDFTDGAAGGEGADGRGPDGNGRDPDADIGGAVFRP